MRILAGLILLSGIGAAGLILWPDRGSRVARDVAPPEISGADPLSILTYGTSLTALYAWPDDLGADLEACLGVAVEVTRLARPGAGSDWATAVLDQAVTVDADLVVLEFAINDADLTDGASFARSRENHAALLEALTPDAPVILMTMNPVTGTKRLTRPGLARYYGLYAELAVAPRVGLLDLTPRWRMAFDEGTTLPDGLHPDDGDASRLIVPPLAAMIAQAVGGSC